MRKLSLRKHTAADKLLVRFSWRDRPRLLSNSRKPSGSQTTCYSGRTCGTSILCYDFCWAASSDVSVRS